LASRRIKGIRPESVSLEEKEVGKKRHKSHEAMHPPKRKKRKNRGEYTIARNKATRNSSRKGDN